MSILNLNSEKQQAYSAQEIIDRVIGDYVREEFTRMLSGSGKLTPEFVKEISTVDHKVGVSDQLYKEIQQSKKQKPKVRNSTLLKEPKKPLTSYMCFCKDKRAEIKSLNPDMKFSQLSRLMGAQWRSLSLTEKHKYVMKAVDERTRYSSEMKEYIRPTDQELVEEKKFTRKRSIGTSKGLKRPVSSYMFFSKDKTPEIMNANPHMTLKELYSELGRLWREVFNTEQVREKWVKLAEVDSTRYYDEKAKALSDDENGKSDLDIKSRKNLRITVE